MRKEEMKEDRVGERETKKEMDTKKDRERRKRKKKKEEYR